MNKSTIQIPSDVLDNPVTQSDFPACGWEEDGRLWFADGNPFLTESGICFLHVPRTLYEQIREARAAGRPTMDTEAAEALIGRYPCHYLLKRKHGELCLGSPWSAPYHVKTIGWSSDGRVRWGKTTCDRPVMIVAFPGVIYQIDADPGALAVKGMGSGDCGDSVEIDRQWGELYETLKGSNAQPAKLGPFDVHFNVLGGQRRVPLSAGAAGYGLVNWAPGRAS